LVVFVFFVDYCNFKNHSMDFMNNNNSSGPAGGPYKKGDLIGQRYAVYGVLGRGGFGIVYLVRKTDTQAIYALKTFRDDKMADPLVRERFLREAQVWVDLGRHPYLVRAHFVDEIDFRLWLAMEFIPAGEDRLNSLEHYLRHQPPDLPQSLRWSIQFCRGMEYAYSRGVRSHRDIKPANILIDRQLQVKISDFGLANLASDVRMMGEGGMGTPAYMPPEQFLDANLCDERSDLYSFGVVLYQMAAGGRLPFLAPLPKTGSPQEMAGFYREMFRLHAKIAPAGLDSPLEPIVRRCLEKRPDRRYPSFGDLRADLEALLLRTTGERIEPPTAREMDASDWNNKGMSLDTLGLYAEAGPCFEQALELDPTSAVVWNNRANNLRQLGRFAEADACYDRALALDPSSAMAWNNKGGALLVSGRDAESVACFEKAIERRPSYALAWHNRGFALNHLGRFEEAAGVFDRALELNPRSVFSWYQKGNALRSLGREAEAAACYAGAVELDPQFALSALRHFDHALELNPRDAAAWYDKAEAEERLLRKGAAADSYRHYLELSADPNAPQAELARRRVRELER
jgi:serine/threonine protein kinase